ncbi:MAG: hypothetical protein SFU53_09705 [Terrimicrobiaceae bacterium]|nr:hypothetical protein [Terrimicrobiaceae bacterium]
MRPFLAVILLLAPAMASADLMREVPRADRAKLEDGQTVVRSTDVPGAPWPKLSLYRVVNAPPSVVAELFTDYDAAPDYTPGMLNAEVLTTNPDGTKDVRYTVKMPVIQKTSYVVRNTYEKEGENFTVSWKLLKSPIAKASEGSLRIEPFGDDRTILCYSNFLVPVTNLVAGLKGQALTEAKNTVLALASESERRANKLAAGR